MLQSIMVANNISYDAIIDFIKLINVVIGKNKIPESKYIFQKICTDTINFTKLYFCLNCHHSFGVLNDTRILCPECNDQKKDYFISTPIKERLQKMVNENFEDIMTYKDQLSNLDPNEISDVNNGMWYKSLSIGQDFFTVNINTDGVAPFNASKNKSLWPILLTLNDLRPTKRFQKQNILSAGYWMSEMHPKMSLFLKPFIHELNDLYETGISIRRKKIKIVLCCFCLDSVARAKCLCIK